MMCCAPCRNTTKSLSCIVNVGCPSHSTSHSPSTRMWNSTRHSALGMTIDASTEGGGDTIAHGAENSPVKKTAPDSRTTRSTSESTSMESIFSESRDRWMKDKDFRMAIQESRLCDSRIERQTAIRTTGQSQ